jgi:hypothetical protein
VKSLAQIEADNVMTPRDYGDVCNHFVFLRGDFLAAFVDLGNAEEFASNHEYLHGESVTISSLPCRGSQHHKKETR